MSDNLEVRKRLTAVWRSVEQRMVDAGFSQTEIFESMIEVALGSWTRQNGWQATANYLHLAADQIAQDAAKQAQELIGAERPRYRE